MRVVRKSEDDHDSKVEREQQSKDKEERVREGDGERECEDEDNGMQLGVPSIPNYTLKPGCTVALAEDSPLDYFPYLLMTICCSMLWTKPTSVQIST